MGQVKNTKKSNKRANLIAIALLTLFNALILVLLVIMGRYIQIQSNIFLIVICAMVALVLLVNVLYILGYLGNINFIRRSFIAFTAVLTLLSATGTYYAVRANDLLNQVVDLGDRENVEYVLITMDPANTLQNIESQSIAYFDGDEDYTNALIGRINTYSRTASLIPYERSNLFDDLISGEIAYAIVPENYKNLYAGDKSDLSSSLVIDKFMTEVKVTQSNVEVLKEPFSVLLLGLNENLSDSIIVVTVNPQSFTVTMTSLARDSYVPIACYAGQARDKLTHARAYGRECTIKTIENMLDMDIDFYFETDFYAIVKVVDALGGIEIDSPITFGGSLPYEDDPEKFHEITVEQGLHLVNGMQAITFARERARLNSGDFERQMNQQYVIKQIASKVLATRNVNTLINVLDAAKDNISTNLSVDDLSALMGYFLNFASQSSLNIMDSFRIIQSQVSGSTPMVDGMSVVVPDTEQLAQARALISWNLGGEWELSGSTAFEFSVNERYARSMVDPNSRDYPSSDYTSTPETKEEVDDSEETPPVSEAKTVTVPDFIGQGTSAADIKAWGVQNKIVVNIRLLSENDLDDPSIFNDGQILYQSSDPHTKLEQGFALDITIVKFSDAYKQSLEEGSSSDGNSGS